MRRVSGPGVPWCCTLWWFFQERVEEAKARKDQSGQEVALYESSVQRLQSVLEADRVCALPSVASASLPRSLRCFGAGVWGTVWFAGTRLFDRW
jgi:hypothetical protein